MRKTEYNSYVEVYMTTEEQCALHRIMRQIKRCVIIGDNKNYTDIREMRSVDIQDIEVLHDLVGFAYDNPPDGVCKNISVDASVRRLQRIKKVS